MNMPNASQVGSERVRRKRAARQERILATAMQLLADEGLENLTVVRLAAKLDYTAGALYRYFPSKDALLAQLQRHAVTQIHAHFRDELDELATHPEVDAADDETRATLELLAAADFYIDLLERLPQHLQLIRQMLADPRPLISDEAVEQTTAVPIVALLGEVSALFEAAVSSGALAGGNALDRTLIYWSSLQGIVQLDKLGRLDATAFDPRRLGRELASSLLAGWGAEPDVLANARRTLESTSDDVPSTH